ncbi:hypothetical protein BP5796_05722 [Coleophoma crateriformis]|uniref:NADPH--cytochrome P450 reductase n=1 Tax=Coleophoma crateriformis TaxID=565419 RepID=A0A3D8RVA0_9HELO|nr:hypothetical protein BP5796_05722 [Coleophoma crateriformis]
MSKLFGTSHLAALDTLLIQTHIDDIIFILYAVVSYTLYHRYVKEKPDPYHHIWFDRPQSINGSCKTAESRNISTKLDENNKDGVIFWGSQSGTAETFATRLARDCRSRFGLEMLVADLSDYDPQSIGDIPTSKFAIFIVSTYGEGDPSDNAAQFVSWLASNGSISLSNLRYAAFGLGNSKYQFYNRIVDVVTQSMDTLGATMMMPVGKADDAQGATVDHFIAWKNALFKHFVEILGYGERPYVYEPAWKIIDDPSLDIIDLHTGDPVEGRSDRLTKNVATSSIQRLPIKSIHRLLSTESRNFIHVEIDIGDYPEMKYRTGDHLAVWPSNPQSEVDRLLKILNLEGSRQTPLLISAVEPSTQTKIPNPVSWETLFRSYLEICAPVSRETLISLSRFADCPSVRAGLEKLGADVQLYQKFCASRHINFGRVLEHFTTESNTWSKLPQSFLLESLAALAPRYYSISSSSIVSPKRLSITVAIDAVSIGNLTTGGLNTSYISAICTRGLSQSHDDESDFTLVDQGTKFYAQVRASKFRLPVLAKHPIIMVCAGSGIAPFRGFIAERTRLAQIGREVGKMMLFFGCRNEDDYLYREEFETIRQENPYTLEIILAYSRSNTGPKRYVQDEVAERKDELARLMTEHGGYLYICGSASMARDVTSRIGECVRDTLHWKRDKLDSWLAHTRRTHRWQEDVWG